MIHLLSATAPTFTRPSNTTAYAAGDLVANSTTAGSVVPLRFDFLTDIAMPLMLTHFRLRKSTNTTANGSFKLHLFSGAPTFSTNGDNDAISGNTTIVGDPLAQMILGGMGGFVTNGVGFGVPMTNSLVYSDHAIQMAPAAGMFTVYGVLEALAAYAPGSAETFSVSLFGRTMG